MFAVILFRDNKIMNENILKFKNEVLCRRDSNQHKARKIFNQLNLTEEQRTIFQIEWGHYMLNHISRENFIKYIEELYEIHSS
jgi:hypothetical protein